MKFGISTMVATLREIREHTISRGVVLAFALVTAFTVSMPMKSHAAQSYDSGTYGDCSYSQGCDPAAPTTVVPVPPSKTNHQKGRAFSVNIVPDQKFVDRSYKVIVIPNFSPQQIDKIELYVGDKLVGSSIEAGANNSYNIDWQLPKNGKYIVRVVIRLRDGGLIEKQFSVVVEHNAKTPPIINSVDKADTLIPTQVSLLNRIANSTPQALAYALPYLFFMLLGGLLLVLLYQVRNQLSYISTLLGLLERDKQLADEKANFIMLASHYVRTPLTILAGAIDLALRGNSTDELLMKAKTSVEALHNQAESILAKVQQNEDLQSIKAPNISSMRSKLYRSWQLILPISLSALLVIAMNVLYISAKRINLVIPSIIIQIILFLLLSTFLYSLLQRQRQQKDEEKRVRQQLEYEEALDKARNSFISLSAEKLAPKVAQVKTSFDESNILQTNTQIGSAISQLESLVNRFVLVTALERGKISRSLSEFDMKPILQKTIAEFEPTIVAKNLKFKQLSRSLKVKQSQILLQYVMRILLDNAVKFTPESGRVSVKTDAHGKHKAKVVIRNYGQAIEPSKLERLFQPFTRTQGAEIATESGAGLSLYLARLIMRYLEGDVSLQSDAVMTTTAQITVPRKLMTEIS